MTGRQPSRAGGPSDGRGQACSRDISAPVEAIAVLSALVGSGASIPDAVTTLLADAAMPDAEIIAAAFDMARHPADMGALLSDLAPIVLFREDPTGVFAGMDAAGRRGKDRRRPGAGRRAGL